ncbi:MAG: LysM peptidoglycan-binding domain-containing protein [Bdellovibrionales bacterium]|nr:LysM peptidoglycan-binding domain-containing protein [Bdellovibrionales bacterium]
MSAREHGGILHRLKNRGPAALSGENPYIAANLLLTQEMERSPELDGFIKHRGAPAAVELEQDYFSPLKLYLYYPENREYYELEDSENLWIIRGPYTISRNTFNTVIALTRSQPGEPLLQNDQSDFDRLKTGQLPSQIPSETELASSAPTPHGEPGTPARTNSFQSPRVELTERNKIDEIIQKYGRAPAELTPKGDLVHYVTFPGETLSLISRWYTRDRSNVGRISRMNNLQQPNQLTLGDTIIIPSYLVKNTNRLNEDAVRALARLAQEEKL